MKAPQKNSGSVVASATSMSMSQAERFFVRGASKSMKMTRTIVGNSVTGQKKLTARKWAALIGFSIVETRKQDQKCGGNRKGS